MNYTLNFLETKLTKSDSDIDILISRLKHMKLMNKNMTVQQLKSNMDSIFTFKQDIKCIEKSLNKIYELYTQFLEEEIIKKVNMKKIRISTDISCFKNKKDKIKSILFTDVVPLLQYC